MLKNIFKISNKYRLILITNIAGIISVILTFITPATKIYYVNFIVQISNEVEYQRLFNSGQLNRQNIYQEITESIDEHIKFKNKNNTSSCKTVLNNNNYNTFKYLNIYLVEFQLSHNEKNLNAVNECFDEFEKIITKVNNNYVALAKFIYSEKYAIFNYQNNNFRDSYNFQNFLNNDEIKLNKNIIVLSKTINETESLFDNKISRFFCYFIILSFLFIFLVNYKKFELLIKKYHY
jgi:hypothetical protein